MPPFVSVVIPSYNHRNFIGAAIASVQAQTYSDVEIVVVDDGSTDGSFDYIRSTFGAQLAWLDRHDNRGAHATLNEAIAHCRGEWISILNSDDLYRPERLERLLAFAADGGHDVVFSDVALCDADGDLPAQHKLVQAHARAMAAAAQDTVGQALLRGNFVLTTSNLMVRRAAFDTIGPFAPFRYCHDWDFLLRAVASVRVGWLRQPLLGYRVHANNTISEADRWRHLTEKALVYACFLGRAGEPVIDLPDSDYVFESREFSPWLVCWLAAECRRSGVAAVLAELEQGKLHLRVRAAFEPRFRNVDPGMTVRDVLKRGRLRTALHALFPRFGAH